MIQYIKKEDTAEFEQFVRTHPKGHYMQSAKWGGVKKNWKHVMMVSKDASGTIKGSMSILLRKVPVLPYKLMYCPRGPVCDIYDEATIRELTEEAHRLAKKERAYVMKIDPDVKKTDAKFAEIMQKCGYTIGRDVKNFEGVQPRFVFRLDIKDKTEEEVMAIFHPKTRYNIRLAVKKGVTAKIGTREELADFHKIMIETGARDGFVVRSLAYFQNMYDALGEHCRLYLMEFEGKPVAGSIAIWYGNKVWYLYGASSNEYRNVMPNYLMQWEMIKWAVEKGCEIYDFRGVSGDISEDNPLYGLYRFKKGFNGEFTEFIPELSLIHKPFINMLVNKMYQTVKMLRKTRHQHKKTEHNTASE